MTEIGELGEAEQRWRVRQARLEKEFAGGAEDDLMVVTAGDDPVCFAAEVEKADIDTLDASIKEIERQIVALLENEQRAVQETTGAPGNLYRE